MSYNIDTFRLRSIKLVLPIGFSWSKFEREQRQENEYEMKLDGVNFSVNRGGEGFQMEGTVDMETGELIVDFIDCYGECSGHDYEDLLKPLFKEFKGDLECSTVWEGGDSIKKLTIKKGVAIETDIEI